MSEPRLFDEVIEDRNLSDVHEAIDARIGALAESVWDILFHFEDEDESFDRQGMLQESIEQFAADLDRDIPALMAGTIMKQFPADPEKKPTVEQVAAYITTAIRTEGDMKLFENATDDEREALSKMWKQAEKAEPAEAEVAKLKTEKTELQKKLDAAPSDDKPDDDDTDILKGLDPEVRKIIEPILVDAGARVEKAEGRVTTVEKTLGDMKKSTRRGELSTIAKTLTGLAMSDEKLTDALVAADENGTLETVQGALEASQAASERVLDQIGSDGDGLQDGSAEAKLDSIAKGIQKKNTGMTYAKAYEAACADNAELQEEAIAESQ